MFSYYKEEQHEEHMLFANEIAGIYNIYDEANKLDALHVANIIRKYIKKHNIQVYPLFYNTRYGLKRVYPCYIYSKAMEEFLEGEV